METPDVITLNYKKYGEEGPALIVLHGFLGSLDNWHTLATEWSKTGLRVYTLDLRNHGKSPHTKEHSLELMTSDLADFMMQQELASAVILGHSMGGKVAMQFALTYPEKTDKLIVADIAPRAYKPGAHDDVFKAILNVDLTKITNRKEAEAALAVYLGDPGTRQFVLKSLERDQDRFQWKFNLEVLYRDYRNVITEVKSDRPFTGPVLFIRGDQSLYIQEKDHEAIRQLFPAAVFATIPNAGHWLHADQPALVLKAIADFVNA